MGLLDTIWLWVRGWPVDSIQKWVTLVAAVIAAVGAVSNLRGKRDKIKVVYGSKLPPMDPREYLHVISFCDHPVELVDYGFIMESHKLLSILYLNDDEPGDYGTVVEGSRFLKSRNENYEIGTTLRDRPIGAYARTVSQDYPTLGFRYDVRWWRAFWVRLVLRAKAKYE